MIGGSVGGYRVVETLGEGGMGVVYVAEHALLGRRAAVKVLLPEYCKNQEFVERFFNEARAAAAIKHPGIVEVYDFGHRDDGSAYIVMELLEGDGLAKRIARLGTVPPPMAINIGRQIASALAAAHRHGIVHRDLKPDNVFLIADPDMPRGERVKLLDFGIAKLSDEHKTGVKTKTGLVMGTPTYMSPEQCKGAGNVTHQADLYSLGCILFEMITGDPPFRGDGVGEVIAKHIYEPPDPTALGQRDVPAPLAQLVLSLLAKKPEQRPADASAVKSALGALVGGLARATTAPPPQPAPQQVAAAEAPRFKTTLTTASSQVPVAPAPTGAALPPRGSRWIAPVLAATAALALALVFLVITIAGGNDNKPAPVAGADISDDAAPVVDLNEAPGPAPAPAAAPGKVAATGSAGDAPPSATLAIRIESTPRGATVTRDDGDRGEALLGQTPLDLEVSDATLELEVSKAGYQSERMTVSPAAGKTYRFVLAEARTTSSRRTSRRPSGQPSAPASEAPSPTTTPVPPSSPTSSPPSTGRLNPFDEAARKEKRKAPPNPFD